MSFDDWGSEPTSGGASRTGSEDIAKKRSRISPAAAAFIVVGALLLLYSFFVKLTVPDELPASGLTFMQEWGWLIGSGVAIVLMLVGQRINKRAGNV